MWMVPGPEAFPWWVRAFFWVFRPLFWWAERRELRYWQRELSSAKPVPTVGAGWFYMPVPWWLRILFWRPWKQ